MSSPAESYAAIDLGSNSFHMVVANSIEDRIQIVDKLKDMVRLAGGLDENDRLQDEVMNRALECLQRFGQRLENIPRKNIRAVGTNTLRQAKNGRAFMKKASKALGVPLEIISGREEARLIFSGVGYSNFNEQEQRLVVDIGGGSTEFAIGIGYDAHLTESLDMGCVSMSQRFFKEGSITAKKMRKAMVAARQELELIEKRYKQVGWQSCLGSSGTINSISDVIASLGGGDRIIKVGALTKLREQLIEAGHIDKLKLEGLSSSRVPVFAGGVAILCAVFESLKIESMQPSEGALREGILLDLFGRQHSRDMRNKTVAELVQRYSIEEQHAENVRATANACFVQLRENWKLDSETDLKLLGWASSLHEMGLAISHSQYHKHGAYLLTYSDLPGFSQEEQFQLAFLVRCHRRKLSGDIINELPDESREKLLSLAIILRISVVLNRNRLPEQITDFQIDSENGNIHITFSEGWLEKHPLTEADLATEAGYLKDINISLPFE